MIKRIFLYLWLLNAFCSLKTIYASNKNVGFPLITNYKAEVYRAHPQNFGVIQDDRGIMYFANGNGVLVYDGSSWEIVELPNKIAARAFGKDKNGTIYTAGTNEIGYLQTNKFGKFIYISLIDSLGLSHLGTFKDIISLNDCIYFRSEDYIIRLNNKGFSKWKAKSNFIIFFLYNNDLYVQDDKNGLFKLDNDSLVLAPAGKEFINKPFYFAKQLNKEVILANRIKGLYKYNPESEKAEKLKPFASTVNQILIDCFIYTGIITKDSIIVLGTNSGGCFTLNSKGEILSKIDIETGILQNKVHALFIDKDDNLWLALDNGISRCDYSGSISYWNEHHGLDGTIQAIIQSNGKMYIGTLQGLYYLKNSMIYQIQCEISQAWSFLNFKIPNTNKELLLIGTLEGVFVLENDKPYKIANGMVAYKLFQSPINPNIIYIGSNNNLGVLEYNGGHFIFRGLIPNTGISIRSIVEKDNGEIWLGTFRDGVTRITPSNNLLAPKKIEIYTTKSGLPSLKNILLYHFNNKLVFATEQGFYCFDSLSNKFIPDKTLGDVFKNGSKDIFNFTEDFHGGAYITQLMNYHGSIGHATRNMDGSYQWRSRTYNKIPRMMMLVTYLDFENNLWIGGSEGLYKFDQTIKNQKDTVFNTFIRKASIKRDSIIFYGNYYTERDGKKYFTSTQNQSFKYNINYKFNSITFNYSAPDFNNELELKYKFILEGYDDKWSDWSTAKTKEYTNLNEGFYKFRVLAKNIYDTVGEESSFEFRVLPPWYRTTWAFVFYFLLSVSLIYIIVYLNGRRLKALNIQLEKIVQERTNDLSEVNTQLEEQQAELEVRQEEISAQAELLERTNQELEKLSIVASETDNAVIIMNYTGEIEWVNESFTRLYGFTLNELKTNKGSDVFKSSSNPHIKEIFEECITSKESQIYETEPITKSGDKIWVQTTLTPILNRERDVTKVIAIDSNITKLKTADNVIIERNKQITAQAELLEKNNNELLLLNSTKDKFFRIIAHDLRNPFNSILGFSDLIISKIESGDKEKSLSFARLLHQTSAKAYELLENLLTWSRSQSGNIQFKPENLNIKRLIDSNVILLEGSAQIKGIKLVSNLSDDLFVYADKNMLFTIIRNLVTNALKFSRASDNVNIDAKELDGHVVVSVSDTGIGMSEDTIKKLFKVEEHIKTEGTANEPGTGLGLILCKEFVTYNKGRIWVESTVDQGSCVSFTLQKGSEQAVENQSEIIGSGS